MECYNNHMKQNKFSTIKILISGYVKQKNKKEYASSSAVLIKYNNKNIIVDPGMDRKKLLNALKKEKLTTDKIDFCILTHTHIDHSLLAGIFEHAKIYDNESIFSYDGKIENHNKKISGTDIKILQTPGHDQFHCSILVNTKEYGKVIIAGDVFWWEDKVNQRTDKKSLMNLKDPYVKNKQQLQKSRKYILENTDYVIPGHGKMFEVKK